jgi:hypothetical protein
MVDGEQGKLKEFTLLHILRGQQLRRLTLGMSWRNKCGVLSAACREFSVCAEAPPNSF